MPDIKTITETAAPTVVGRERDFGGIPFICKKATWIGIDGIDKLAIATEWEPKKQTVYCCELSPRHWVSRDQKQGCESISYEQLCFPMIQRWYGEKIKPPEE